MLELNCWIYNHEFHWLYKRKYISCHKCGRVWAMDASGLNPTGMPHLDLFLLLNPDNPSPPGQSKLLPSSVDRSAPLCTKNFYNKLSVRIGFIIFLQLLWILREHLELPFYVGDLFCGLCIIACVFVAFFTKEVV